MKTMALSQAILSLAFAATPAFAGVVAYSSESDFASAVTIAGTDTFETFTPGGGLISDVTSGLLSFGGVSKGIGTAYGPGTGQFLASYAAVNIYPVSSAVGTIYGIGFDIGCYSCDLGNPNDTVVVTDSGGAQYTFSAPTLNNFWGVGSTVAIGSIDISIGSYGFVSLDNVSYGSLASPGDTPEPATFVLTFVGLTLLLGRGRSVSAERS